MSTAAPGRDELPRAVVDGCAAPFAALDAVLPGFLEGRITLMGEVIEDGLRS